MITPNAPNDDTLKLGHGDPLAAKAPARKFEVNEAQDKTLLSPGIFAVLAMGLGAYLGRLRDIVNPSPNSSGPSQKEGGLLDEATPVTADDEEGGMDIATFWQEIQRRFEDAVEELPPQRRLYSSIRFNSQDFVMEGSYAGRPFQGVQIDLADNGFRFISPLVVKPRLQFPSVQSAANAGPSITIPTDGTDGNTGGSSGGSSGGSPNPGGGSGTPGNGGPSTPPGGGSNTPVNKAPLSRGTVYFGTGLVNLSMLLVWADFARAAVDPDGDRLQISAIQTSSGEIRTYGSDAWIYVPERDKLGIVTLTFTVSDGKASIQGQAFLDLRAHPANEIIGTGGDDVLIGTPGEDLIDAGAGNDIVYGREANDLILGGAGDDLLIGGAGRDVIHGGAGHDRIFGGDGDDILFGEEGDDTLFGEDGRDSLVAGAGNDVLSGGDGDDRLYGEDGNDVLSGDAGADMLDGGAGADTLAGGFGNDVVVGGDGNDVYVAGGVPVLQLRSLAVSVPETPGASVEVFPAPHEAVEDDGDDVVHGGDGNDTYDASSAMEAVAINLDEGTASGAEIGQDILTAIENAVGGGGDDTLTASSAVNILYGGGGQDTFVFGSVASIANGGQGLDEIRDFDVGDKVDLSKLERELGRLYFDDGETSTELNGDDHKTLVKLYKKMIDDDDAGHQVLQLITDIDGDTDYEIVIISASDLDADDLILTAFHLPGQVEGLVA